MPEFREIANRVNELLVDDEGATDDAGGATDADGTAVAGV
jgi:NitT/TauT family transport system ATP-binding protein